MLAALEQPLLTDRDRLRLGLTDPDREEPFPVGLPEQHALDEVTVRQAQQQLFGAVAGGEAAGDGRAERGEVLGTAHTGEGTELRVRVDQNLAAELEPFLVPA